MVISEAMAARVPVVISDVCGAAVHVTSDSGAVLSLSASLGAWVKAVEQQLIRAEDVPLFERPWRHVAQEYVRVYALIDRKRS
jgi:UDP-glucose:(heptosyl)LPS alpha-1,3-glucosyltransferase